MYHCCTIVYNTGNPNAVLANRMIRCIYAVLATKIIRCIYLYSSVFMGRFGRDLNLIRDGQHCWHQMVVSLAFCK